MHSIQRLTTPWVFRIIALGLGLLALGAVAAAPALAATATSNMSVTATVTALCTIAAGPLAFGNYDSTAATPLDGTATLTVTCTILLPATITLGQGSNPASGSTDTVPLRRMKDTGSDFLSYFLYQETGRTTVWGNTAATGVALTGTGLPQLITVFGRMPASQNEPVGAYSDIVVATITF